MTMQPETAPCSEYIDIDEKPAPAGRKVLLLTDTGVAIIGSWYEEGNFVAWAPLLRIPPRVKAKLCIDIDPED